MAFSIIKKMHIVSLILLGLGFILCVSSFKAYAGYSAPNAYIVIDADTGKVLAHEDSERTLHPASLTKLMTLLLTFEALDSGKIRLSSKVPMSSYAASMPPSKSGVKAGKSITVEQAIKLLVTKSANDVAVALGEKLGGDVNRFARMMNKKADALGMNQSHFVNPSGLHHSAQTSSPRDMAKLALYIIRSYPQYYPVFSIRDYYFKGKSFHNHNRLMNSYRGMDGMKTGYISQSGFNLVASAKRSGVRLIGVVFGGTSANARNSQMAELLDDGFSQMRVRGGDERTAHYEPRRIERTERVEPEQAPAPILKRIKPKEQEKEKPAVKYQLVNPEPSARKSSPILKTIPEARELSNTVGRPHYNDNDNSAPKLGGSTWSIQIGAFQDRVSTDQAIYRAIQKLPSPLNRGNPIVIPLRTAEAVWVFRARIGGYTREQATQACRHLENCLAISPSSN